MGNFNWEGKKDYFFKEAEAPPARGQARKIFKIIAIAGTRSKIYNSILNIFYCGKGNRQGKHTAYGRRVKNSGKPPILKERTRGASPRG
jgi:hypothetical protein